MRGAARRIRTLIRGWLVGLWQLLGRRGEKQETEERVLLHGGISYKYGKTGSLDADADAVFVCILTVERQED